MDASATAEVESKDLYAAKLQCIAAYHADGEKHWWLHRRVLDDGRVVFLMQMLGQNLRLAVSPDEQAQWFTDQIYCYHDHDAAWRAALGWNGQGDPEGWYKHPPSGRRRPDGTVDSEYVEH